MVRRAAELGAEEQALAEKIGRAAECREQRDAARTRMEVSRELGQLLGANNLQTYVLADAMRVLVEDGSLHLQRLSDGRYRLSAEDLDLHVVDAWNGDAVRSVKTLSGGETFLTSLALALAERMPAQIRVRKARPIESARRLLYSQRPEQSISSSRSKPQYSLALRRSGAISEGSNSE